jgi:hypothetical protein
MRGLIPYSMTCEAQLVMRQLVQHKKRNSAGRALPVTSVSALLILPACGSDGDSSAGGGTGKKGFTLRIGMTSPSRTLSGRHAG